MVDGSPSRPTVKPENGDSRHRYPGRDGWPQLSHFFPSRRLRTAGPAIPTGFSIAGFGLNRSILPGERRRGICAEVAGLELRGGCDRLIPLPKHLVHRGVSEGLRHDFRGTKAAEPGDFGQRPPVFLGSGGIHSAKVGFPDLAIDRRPCIVGIRHKRRSRRPVEGSKERARLPPLNKEGLQIGRISRSRRCGRGHRSGRRDRSGYGIKTESRLLVPHRQRHHDNQDNTRPERGERFGRQHAANVSYPVFRGSRSEGVCLVVFFRVQKRQRNR